jgi:hypothetical protein
LVEQIIETRLDLLWQAVTEGGAEADWLRFYEGFAAQTLIVPVDDTTARPRTLTLETGDVALAFDTEGRFTAFITTPTEFITLTGAGLACALEPLGVGVALNPGVAPGETVLGAEALAWIAQHAGADVAVEDVPGGVSVGPPVKPEAALLEALGIRLAEMAGHVAEAWLLGVAAPDGGDTYLCVLRPAPKTALIADGIAAEITRIGQIRTSRSFSVTVVDGETRLLVSARHFGIGLSTEHPSDGAAMLGRTMIVRHISY